MRIKSLAVLLLPFVSAIAIRGDDHHNGMAMDDDVAIDSGATATATHISEPSKLVPVPHVEHMHHGVPILATHLKPEERLYWEAYNTTTFLTETTSPKFNLYVHIAAVLTTAVFVYPLTLVAKNVANYRLYYSLFSLHVILMTTAFISLAVYGRTAPVDLYPNNAYSKMTKILVFSTIAQIVSVMIFVGARANELSYSRMVADEENSLLQSTSPSSQNETSSSDWEASDRYELNRLINEKSTALMGGLCQKISHVGAINKVLQFCKTAAKRTGRYNMVIFQLLNWGHFFYFLVYIPTGVAVIGVFGKGVTVFNLLAHFIKGGVFFAFGLLSLARYSGAFSEKGWAWNCNFIQESNKRCITMEMLESSLILFYGCTNIFMEHFANPGGEWSAKDLQHASIAFIYIGAGLCGVITESKLTSWRFEKAIEKLRLSKKSSIVGADTLKEADIKAAHPGYSPNPFPLFTIFWTGILMSKHAQASALSTAIHTQWGQLFVYGTIFRFMTYVLLMFLPTSFDNLTRPSKPITELLTSFSLLCGGLMFMVSCDPVVLALEYRGFTSMFTLNICLGFVALLMAWEMVLFSIKDFLATRRT
jgi:hypothetical protein